MTTFIEHIEQAPPVKHFSVVTDTGIVINTNGYQQACATALDMYKKGTKSSIVISYSNPLTSTNIL